LELQQGLPFVFFLACPSHSAPSVVLPDIPVRSIEQLLVVVKLVFQQRSS
jgi:hypothetical protein